MHAAAHDNNDDDDSLRSWMPNILLLWKAGVDHLVYRLILADRPGKFSIALNRKVFSIEIMVLRNVGVWGRPLGWDLTNPRILSSIGNNAKFGRS